ncbi:MAG: hypothetical protein IJZ57_03990 [Clostridia bacterium]|nr:hypothetical protein [Clostridia bacterium]
MKRFYSAIILLIFIIVSSYYINSKIIHKTQELMHLTEVSDAQAIISWWEENEVLFEALLPGELNNPVHTNILLLEKNHNNSLAKDNLQVSAEKILESLDFSVKNIF